MDTQQAIIAKAHRAVTDLPRFYRGIRDALLKKDGSAMPGEAAFMQDGIEIGCLGHSLTAKPRPVKTESGEIVAEFVFRSTKYRDAEPIWTMYLTSNGDLYKGVPGKGERMCTHSDEKLRDHLLVELGHATLNSYLFAPELREVPLGGLDAMIDRLKKTQGGKYDE